MKRPVFYLINNEDVKELDRILAGMKSKNAKLARNILSSSLHNTRALPDDYDKIIVSAEYLELPEKERPLVRLGEETVTGVVNSASSDELKYFKLGNYGISSVISGNEELEIVEWPEEDANQ